MGVPALPRLHVVTDDAVLARSGFAASAAAVLEAGGGGIALHLRGRHTSGAALYALARELRVPARTAGAALLANDRVDVARLADLDGVHLGEGSLPPADARALLPVGRWVGASAHDPAGARARAVGVDYLVVGSVFATASHPGRAGAGPDLVARVRACVRVPLVAIGGIGVERIPEVLTVGAEGVAVLSGVWGAPDPVAAVAAYLAALPGGPLVGARPADGSGGEGPSQEER